MKRSFKHRRRLVRRRKMYRNFVFIVCFIFVLLGVMISWTLIGKIIIKNDLFIKSMEKVEKIEETQDSERVSADSTLVNLQSYAKLFEDDVRTIYENKDNSVRVTSLLFETVKGYQSIHNYSELEFSDVYDCEYQFMDNRYWRRAWKMSFIKEKLMVIGYNYKEKKDNHFFHIYYLTSDNYSQAEAVKDLKKEFNCNRFYIKRLQGKTIRYNPRVINPRTIRIKQPYT